VKNAIDSSYFKRSNVNRGEALTRFGLPANAIVVGAVGRLNGEKDYSNFLDMAQILLRCRQDLYFTIAGKGELEQDLKNRIREMGLEGRVHLLGHFHDVRSVYEMLDVYVLSSTREGLPNTVLEAMALEVPIAATDVDGVSEAAAHDREALLVPARDPANLAGAVNKLLADRTLAQRLTRSARTKIENEFSFASRVRHEERIYERVLYENQSSAIRNTLTCGVL
jgi:glycosyltransferase involved in cell wall biosynthesis